MSKGLKVPYADAKKVADDLLILLGDHFERLEIAGSLRRKKALIGDIELVGILQTIKVGLFGFSEILPTRAIIELMGRFGYKAEKAGEKYIKFVSNRKMNVDLFLCTPETWGCIFMIRTGSAEFTRKMVTQRAWGGYCPFKYYFFDGRLIDRITGSPIDTSEEEMVFKAMGMDFIAPEERQ